MFEDTERCIRAVLSSDARFDGHFVTTVVTTGIYCRPSCPVVPPKPQNMRFLPTAAAAQAAGFRACKRCRPDAAPGSPEWDSRSDLVARALRLITDGIIDREGVDGLARKLSYSRRQLQRQMTAVLGVGPAAVARAQRAQTARLLLETTSMPIGDVAFSAGFGSVRQFNDTLREVFAFTPRELRAQRHRADAGAAAGTVNVRLAHRVPLHADALFEELVAAAVPGVEEWRDGVYRRTLRLPSGSGIAELRPQSDHIQCRLQLTEMRDFPVAVARCRRLLDLDADPVAVDELLSKDDRLRPLISRGPGRRVPRTVDEAEMAMRVVLVRQASRKTARVSTERLVNSIGEPLETPVGGLTHLFPTAEAVADMDPGLLRLSDRRRQALLELARALATGKVDLGVGADRIQATEDLHALPGLGPTTVGTIMMRALGDPDTFVAADSNVRAAASRLGLPTAASDLDDRARHWRPWRSYAVQYLRSTVDCASEVSASPSGCP